MKIKLSYVLGAILILAAGMFAGHLASAQTPATLTSSSAILTSPAGTPAPRFKGVIAGVIPVRTATEMTVTDTTKRYGFEVYQDTANGNLIYITETGSIAVVRAAK